MCTSLTNDLCIAASFGKMCLLLNGKNCCVWLIVFSTMKGNFDMVRNSMRCQSVHKMEVMLSALPQACLALSSTHRHTLSNRMAG